MKWNEPKEELAQMNRIGSMESESSRDQNGREAQRTTEERRGQRQNGERERVENV